MADIVHSYSMFPRRTIKKPIPGNVLSNIKINRLFFFYEVVGSGQLRNTIIYLFWCKVELCIIKY